jgi:Crp-like helix-turn-helix domain
VAAALLLANFGKDGKPEPMIAKISQKTLADMIGTTRSRVSFFMNKFRKLGFIDYNGGNGGIEVHNSLLNAVLQAAARGTWFYKCPGRAAGTPPHIAAYL